MKKITLTLLIVLTASMALFAGVGTEEDPLTVAQMQAKKENTLTKYWVKGYVVGEVNGYSNNKWFYNVAPPFNGVGGYVYLIADSKDEFELSECVCIQFPTSTADVDACNLDENTEHWKKEIKVYGTREKYLELPGVKKIDKAYYFTTPKPWANEGLDWTFYEDFENRKSYSAYSETSIFAGGEYTDGDGNKWEFKGATFGNSSNDNRWGDAGARIRYTESTSGDKGYIQMMFDKPNGAGEIRLWAGNYKDDSAQQLEFKLEISKDKGASWIVVSQSTLVKRGTKVVTNGMSEYRLYANQTGNIRIRISKADDNTGGMNIDNIRISNYAGTSAMDEITANQLSVYTNSKGVFVELGNEASDIHIYHISGQLYKQINQVSNTQFIPLKEGIYIVKSGDKLAKIVL